MNILKERPLSLSLNGLNDYVVHVTCHSCQYHGVHEVYLILCLDAVLLAVMKHSIKAQHWIKFRDTRVLARMTSDKDHLVKKASEIWLHPNNINIDTEFPLHHLRYLAIKMIEHA
jgi:hypothetical protein